MPYIREGKCVYHKNSDGSKGKKKGCSDSVEGAKKYMKALYVNENKSYAEFSMAITKASISDKAQRTMRLAMVNSDIGEDAYEERMSVELFNDFVARIEGNIQVPEPFDGVIEDGNWKGGMPYLSISHYKSGDGVNVPGSVERVYVDGEKLKSNAILGDNALGLAVWKSVCQDIEDREKPLEERAFSNPVRISIGFLDLEHKHEIEGEDDYIFTRSELKQKCEKCEAGINGKVYLKGQLVHLAFTRVPANPRTQVEVMRMGDEIKTKFEDAESIIGEELANGLVGKSVIDEEEALVVKAEKDYREYANKVERAFSKEFAPPPQPYLYVRSVTDKNIVAVEYSPEANYDESNKVYKIGYAEKDGKFTFDKRSDWVEMEMGLIPKKSKADEDEWEVKFKEPKSESTEVDMDTDNQVETPVEEEIVEEPVEETPESAQNVETVVASLMEKFTAVKERKADKEELQPILNALVNSLNEETSDPTEKMLSSLEERMAAMLDQKFADLKVSVTQEVLKSIPTQQPTAQEIPTPRSILVNRNNVPEKPEEMSEIRKIVLRSMGQQV